MTSEIETEKPKIQTPPLKPQPKPQLRQKLEFSGIRRHEHISTSTTSSSIDLCIQERCPRLEDGVSVYIHPTEINIDMLLSNGKNKDSYRFDGLEVEELRDKFKTAINIREINYKLFTGNVYLYYYPLINQEKVYQTVKDLHKEYTSKS